GWCRRSGRGWGRGRLGSGWGSRRDDGRLARLGAYAGAEAFEVLDEAGEVGVAVSFGGFDGGEHRADGVDCGEQGAGDGRVEDERSIAQAAEQVLGGVGDGLQFLESEEAGGALDGVEGAENAGECFG